MTLDNDNDQDLECLVNSDNNNLSDKVEAIGENNEDDEGELSEHCHDSGCVTSTSCKTIQSLNG